MELSASENMRLPNGSIWTEMASLTLKRRKNELNSSKKAMKISFIGTLSTQILIMATELSKREVKFLLILGNLVKKMRFLTKVE